MRRMFAVLLIASFLIPGCGKRVTDPLTKNPSNTGSPKFEITGSITEGEFWVSTYGWANNWVRENPILVTLIGVIIYKLGPSSLTSLRSQIEDLQTLIKDIKKKTDNCAQAGPPAA